MLRMNIVNIKILDSLFITPFFFETQYLIFSTRLENRACIVFHVTTSYLSEILIDLYNSHQW